ncbi:hypothetical protein B6U79_00875 [Candidatus Bathyarchaeota archaeon ex4484_231]|nr:MAG: hypothetical protein B6U79_00875 [Candidatus Bathyarchaeota archaeon ex4484_231]
MTPDEYFSMIILVLMGLTFVAISLIFLYVVYGEKETTVQTTKANMRQMFFNSFLRVQLTLLNVFLATP